MNDKSIRLLLVEDDKVDQMAFGRFAKNENLPYDYTIAGSVAEAKEILKSTSFDVIILDYMLGDGTSFELFDLFKGLPVIVITGTGNEEVAVEAMKLGAYDYLMKDPEGNYLKTLPSTVELALKRKQTEKELLKHQESLESMVKERTSQLEAEIVERKQAEEALRESEEKHRLLAENTVDCIWKMNFDLEFTYINQAVFPFLGYTPEEWIGSKLPEHCSSEEIEKTQAVILDVLANLSDKTTEVFETTFYHKNGEEIPCEVSGKIVLDDAGNPIYLQGTTRNITERKNLEAQLRQAQKMEAIGTLAGGIAHDFNNLLTTIIGNAQLTLMDISKDDSLRKRIEEIKKAGDRSASLTRQLLAFSRKQVIRPEVLNLNGVINETEKMLKRMIGEDIEFQTNLKPELWKVHMDSGQVDQIIINLAVNARDAMPQGGKLIVETANVDLDKNYLSEHGIEGTPGHYVMLAISDTGSGMNKETREHIFEPFFTTKEIGKGTGLGLSTVYGIAKQNKGFIWVYSEPGQGTTFKIYLPKVREGMEPEKKELFPVDELRGSETVLIVEDDNSLRNLARKILERNGYSVLEAENGEDALRVSEEYDGSIDLMLTDVVMPKISGRETAEQLQPLYPQMKVIYMSGYTDNAIAHHGVLEPGLNFLEKPFSPEGLARKVREVLDK